MGLGSVDCEIHVADGSGGLWASASPGLGVQMALRGQTIPNLPEQVTSQMAIQGEPFEIRSKDKFVARRFYIVPQGRGFTIFARLPDGK